MRDDSDQREDDEARHEDAVKLLGFLLGQTGQGALSISRDHVFSPEWPRGQLPRTSPAAGIAAAETATTSSVGHVARQVLVGCFGLRSCRFSLLERMPRTFDATGGDAVFAGPA